MIYIRARDGQTVSRDEACMAGGVLRAGYSIRVPDMADGHRFAQPGDYIGFELAFMDNAPNGPDRVSLRDTSIADATLNDAAITRDVALVERQHRIRHAYLGDRAPDFTTEMRDAARSVATAAHTQKAGQMRDAAPILEAQTAASRVVRDAALARRRIELANAWKH